MGTKKNEFWQVLSIPELFHNRYDTVEEAATAAKEFLKGKTELTTVFIKQFFLKDDDTLESGKRGRAYFICGEYINFVETEWSK